MVAVTCQSCGKTFDARKERVFDGSRNFCCTSCFGDSLRKGGCVHRGYKNIGIRGEVIPEHRLVAKQVLGRELMPSEIVHHINGDKLDNSPSNLEIMSRHEHGIHHNTLTWSIEDFKAKNLDGWTVEQFAKSVGVAHSGVYAALKRHGVDYIKHPKRMSKATTWDSGTGLEMFRNGKTIKEISNVLGVKYTTVWNWLKKYG